MMLDGDKSKNPLLEAALQSHREKPRSYSRLVHNGLDTVIWPFLSEPDATFVLQEE